MVSRIRVITHPRGLRGLHQPPPTERASAVDPVRSARKYDYVAIGASTGGPGAIVEILRSLPPAFQLPILFVLHINEPFGTAFAEWLDGQTGRRVACPKDGDPIASAVGRVAIAPVGRHLIVRERRMRLVDEPERWSCRPSVDVLFESIAVDDAGGVIACLLTGMGKDGAQGLRKLRQAGGLTIAQDEASSIVYGMPREAALLDAANEILPLGEIGPRLLALQEGRA
jgi:two-component system chemotaxis response regulator CheB